MKTTKLTNQEWYQNLITDLQRLKYKENTDLIVSRWEMGDRLEKEKDKGITKLLKHVSVDSKIGERTLWFCLQFRRKYIKLNEEIKQLPWRENIKKLQNPQEEKSQFKYFNIWNFQSCDEKYGMVGFPGRMPGQVIKNLLYYFTEENDLVIDPMAGSGTTIDVCKETKRNCFASDLNPARKDIKKWDLVKGYPREIKEADFILLDPPYWLQKREEYTKETTDFSQMSLKDFWKEIEKVARNSKDILKKKKYLAIIVGNTQVKNEFIDLGFECYKIFKKYFMPVIRIIVPYSTQQYSGYDIKRVQGEKKILNIYRDLIIFKK